MIESFDNSLLFRCSALGNIVTKSGKLTDGAMTYLDELFIGAVYGVRKEAYGKALEKGVVCEPEARAMLNHLYPDNFIKKVSESKKNDYLIGTSDVIIDGIVYDIKNAYDLFTFGKATLSHIYEWQLRGYMMLYDIPKARLFYCLCDMPDYLIAQEQKSMFYRERKWMSMEDPDYLEACEVLHYAHKYSNMEIWERFKIWEIERTEESEEKIIKCVKQAREYLNSLLKEHNDRIAYNKQLLKL